jgi:hypothetical protein
MVYTENGTYTAVRRRAPHHCTSSPPEAMPLPNRGVLSAAPCITLIKAFENKLWLREFQLCLNNLACISTLTMEITTHTKKYTYIIWVLPREFNSQFKDFRKHQATFIFFSSSVVNTWISIGIIELQSDENLQHKFHDTILLPYQLIKYLQCLVTIQKKKKRPVWWYLYFWTVIFKYEYCDGSIQESTWWWKITELPLVATSQISPDINIFRE